MITHKDKTGVETDIPYICTKELILKENGKERLTVEVFAAGDYKINKGDITQALENIGLIITSGSDVHQPAMGPNCPVPTYLEQNDHEGHSSGAYLAGGRRAYVARCSTRIPMAKDSYGED